MVTSGIGHNAPVYSLSPEQSLTVNILFAVMALVSLLFCLKIAIQEKRPYPIYLFVGGTAAIYYELLTDVLGRCIWATLDEPYTIYALGRELPLFAVFAYMFYFPVACVSMYRALEKGINYQQWWKWALVGIPLAFVFELYPVNQRWWFYYGEGQPLSILGLPLYWSFAAVMALMCSTAATHFICKNLLGNRDHWAITFILPLGVVGFHMPVVFPVHMAISSTTNLAITTIGAVMTIGLALMMIKLVGTALTRNNQ